MRILIIVYLHTYAIAQVEINHYMVTAKPEGHGQLVTIAPKEQTAGAAISVLYDNPLRTLSNAFDAPGKVGVVFSFKSDFDNEILLVRLRDSSVVAAIHCSRYAVAPDRKFLVYRTSITRLTPNQYINPLVMVMDMSHDDVRERQLYPAETRAMRADGRSNFPVSPFLWTPDATELIYFNRIKSLDTAYEYELELIVARYSGAEDQWSVSAKKLDKTSFVKEGTPPRKIQFHVEDLQWVEPGIFRATWHRAVGTFFPKGDSFTMSMDGEILGFRDASIEPEDTTVDLSAEGPKEEE